LGNIKEIINISAKGSLGLYEWKQHETCSDEECSRFLDKGKQGNKEWLQDPNQRNVDNLNNIRLGAIFTLCVLCIVINLRDKDELLAANTVRVIVLAVSQRRCMVNTICCIHSNCLLKMNSYTVRNIDY
jgi:hypothetical protein